MIFTVKIEAEGTVTPAAIANSIEEAIKARCDSTGLSAPDDDGCVRSWTVQQVGTSFWVLRSSTLDSFFTEEGKYLFSWRTPDSSAADMFFLMFRSVMSELGVPSEEMHLYVAKATDGDIISGDVETNGTPFLEWASRKPATHHYFDEVGQMHCEPYSPSWANGAPPDIVEKAIADCAAWREEGTPIETEYGQRGTALMADYIAEQDGAFVAHWTILEDDDGFEIAGVPAAVYTADGAPGKSLLTPAGSA